MSKITSTGEVLASAESYEMLVNYMGAVLIGAMSGPHGLSPEKCQELYDALTAFKERQQSGEGNGPE